VSSTWDYTDHAGYYSARPNYADSVIDDLVRHVGAVPSDSCLIADVGAGTGNLTLMLLGRGLRCVAVEPNAEMRKHGVERTAPWNTKWIDGRGEGTGLAADSIDWVTMGSSFNTMDRPTALVECHRILKLRGCFTCMWNHRDLDDPVQQEIESLIRRLVPTYDAGTRREDQTGIIHASRLFSEIRYIEGSQVVRQSRDNYVAAWRSTRNLKIHAADRFDSVIEAIDRALENHPVLELRYTTRSWTARRN